MACVAHRDEEEIVVIQGHTDYVFYVHGNKFRVRHPNLYGHFELPYRRQFQLESSWFAFFTPEFLKPGPRFTGYHLVFRSDVMHCGVAPFLTPEERGALMAMISELPNIVECDVRDLGVLRKARVSYAYESGMLTLVDALPDAFHLPDWLRSRLCD